MIRPVLVFGGTIEGRGLSDYLADQGIMHTVCVATDYGEEVLDEKPCRVIHQGRLNVQEMVEFILRNDFCVVIDATHPYAVEVSKNIRLACEESNRTYLRYLRPLAQADESEEYVYVDSMREAALYLNGQEGNIFLTTGSKELKVFTELISDKSRLTARVLPSASVISSCRELGLEGRQIIGMQGPFSTLMNEAMFTQAQAKWIVTKNTGTSGGFPEKMEAAKKLGLSVVIIRRPVESGSSFDEVVLALERILENSSSLPDVENREDINTEDRNIESIKNISVKYNGQNRCENGTSSCKIACIGIGMGTMETLTHGAAEAIRNAEAVFGAKRIVESVDYLTEGKLVVQEYEGQKIRAYLEEHPEIHSAAVLMSGDVGFYSGARGIEKCFGEDQVTYYCGISSVVYFSSRIPTAWQDAKLLSAHGKALNLLNYVNRYQKIIMLVSGAKDVEARCRQLVEAGMTDVRVTVGTNLSYPDETITKGVPADFIPCTTTGLHIMMIENDAADYIVTPGIDDNEFVRGKVPMTKEEIRILSLAKLRLREDSVVYDVGAGTGSVSLEAARLCTAGTVYAIERNPEGIGLIQENAAKLGLSNVVTVEGLAPDAMADLPAPTHAFIGGSSGNMKEIIEMLRRKNPKVRIVINTIALESIAEVTMLVKELKLENAEIVHISAAKSRVLGRYHMMTGQNPVYIISFGDE